MKKYLTGFVHGTILTVVAVIMVLAVDVMINGFWIVERAIR